MEKSCPKCSDPELEKGGVVEMCKCKCHEEEKECEVCGCKWIANINVCPNASLHPVTMAMQSENLPKWEEDFYEVLPIVCSPLTADSKVARIKKIFEKLLAAEYERGCDDEREIILSSLHALKGKEK